MTAGVHASRESEGSLLEAYVNALSELQERESQVVVLGPLRPRSWSLAERPEPGGESGASAPDPADFAAAAGLAGEGRTVFVSSSIAASARQVYPAIRQSICAPRANVKIVATDDSAFDGPTEDSPPLLEDIALMRGLPSMTVIVPADAPSTRSATFAVTEFAGPAYLHLTSERLPTVTDGRFAVGRASELRSGSELTIVALGAMVARALEVAHSLHEVGVEARVLDFASVKPFDEKALLRAARDTGAILTLEEQNVLTGLGTQVAATTSENYPVPVRRIGFPDVFSNGGERSERREQYGLSKERALEEAWELLRLRGKVQ